MKRFLLAVLFALAFCNVSFAELPVINPIQPTYRDDNSTVLMSSIQPNREFLMMYQIVVDARSFYAVLLKSNLREFTTSSKTISNEARSVELKIPLQLRSNENAEFTIRVSTESGETREHAITLSATDGEPRIMFESPTVEIETGGSEVISIGRRDVDGKYSIYSLMELMVREGLKYEYSVDDQTIAGVTSDDNLYFHVRGLKPGATALRVKLLTEAEGYPTGDIAECWIKVVDKSQIIPTPPDNGQTPVPQQPEPKKESSGGGCNAGLAGLLALALVPMVRRKRK